MTNAEDASSSTSAHSASNRPIVCHTDSDCNHTANAVCDVDGQNGGMKCACANGYVNQSGNCQPQGNGAECKRNSDCKHFGRSVICHKRSKKCKCKKGYIMSVDGSKCVKIGIKCTSDNDCSMIGPHIGCITFWRRCMCVSGFKPENNSCLPIQLNDGCRNNEDCGHINSSSCALAVSDDKLSNNSNSIISHKKCLCDKGYREDDNGTSCSPRKLNDTCTIDSDCSMKNSSCNRDNSVCACRHGYEATDDLLTCQRQQFSKVSCNKNKQCSDNFKNTACAHHTGFCACRDKFISKYDGYSCFFRYLNNSCSRNEHCSHSVTNSHCLHGKCACLPDYSPMANKRKCSLKIIGGMKCSNNKSCSALVKHSFCDVTNNRSRCACQLGYRLFGHNDKCRDIHLSEKCFSDAECHVTNHYSRCEAGKCECDLGYANVTSSLTKKAFCEKRRVGVHPCETDIDCASTVNNSHCMCDVSNTDSE